MRRDSFRSLPLDILVYRIILPASGNLPLLTHIDVLPLADPC